MKTVFHEEQRLHYPQHFLSSGARQPNPEHPDRVNALLSGARAAGSEYVCPNDYGIAPIAAVHSPEYIEFLKNIYPRWQRISGASAEVLPNVHPDHRNRNYPKSAVGQVGYHTMDTSCPISEHTFQSAYWSANTAVHAANSLLSGDSAAYALCRPPGHHSFRELTGGFCYFNNTAIAAQYLLAHGRRPAIVDVDLHHGNGTQDIFYYRSDVLTVSVHTDPIRYYPFYWGHANERGEGEGKGYNVNFPLPRGTGNDGFLKALETGLERVKLFAPDVLLIALGLDAYENDPFAGLAVSTEGFGRIGQACAALNLPTLLVQEGGYLCPQLGENLTAVLSQFSKQTG